MAGFTAPRGGCVRARMPALSVTGVNVVDKAHLKVKKQNNFSPLAVNLVI